MRITLDVQLDVDSLTAERIMHTDRKHLWKTIDLIANTRPDCLTLGEPQLEEKEGAPDGSSTSG